MRLFFCALTCCPIIFSAPVLAAEAPGKIIRDHAGAPLMVILPRANGRVLAMAQTEVTFRQWQTCVKAKACSPITDDHRWGRGRRPLINVSWTDAQNYVRWLTHLTGRVYRLPTGEEWVWAAQAGANTNYWWGDAMLSGKARCRKCNSDAVSDYGTMPAGSYAANPYGLYDMNGNVWEWVQDCVSRSAQGRCLTRATYGGAWYYFSRQSYSRAMAPRPEAERSFTVGFRVVSERDGF